MTDGVQDSSPSSLDIEQILRMLPHRYPFLLIDRLEEIVVGESAVGIKNVTINEPQFQGHFPGHPVMPGVMLIESMAQTAAALVFASVGEEADGKIVYFMTIDSARFRRPVVPGDRLRVMVEKQRSRGAVWKFKGRIVVDDVLAAEAVFSAMVRDA